MRWKMDKSMKWSWFKVPVKVEQINEYLFSDTIQSQKKQKWQWWIKPSSLGRVQTKVEKKNARDEFLVFFQRELERWQGVM